MNTWLDLVVLALASGAVLQAWFRGSIFVAPRAYLDARMSTPFEDEASDIAAGDDPADSGGVTTPEEATESTPLWMRAADRIVPDFVVEGLRCPLCLSYHIPYLLLICSWGAAFVVGRLWATDDDGSLLRDIVICLLKAPAWSLAATRLANIINALLPNAAQHGPQE